MPQLDQIPEFFASQLFWLIITFGLIYLVIGRGMLPKISATVEARDDRISDDLAAAKALARRRTRPRRRIGSRPSKAGRKRSR